MRYLDGIFSKVLSYLHLPILPKVFTSLSNAIKDSVLYFCPPSLFESSSILMTSMVIHSYLIRKNIYKHQKPSSETLALIPN